MSTGRKDNAFPIFSAQGGSDPDMRGMTKREYFAALAMQGLIAGETATVAIDAKSPEDVAKMAVRHADMLIYALNGEIS